MIQQIIRLITRFSATVFCEKVQVIGQELIHEKGPILVIANHPDSFLDAVLIGAQYRRKIHFMARGDVFKNPIINKILRSFGLIPIHRLSEGKEFMNQNTESFSEAVKILKGGGIVLIFIEGICLNTHELQPFKKGTVRILEICQKEGIFPKVHLAGIAYSDFKTIKKRINIHFDRMDCPALGEVSQRKEFNETVFKRLEPLIHLPEDAQPRALFWASPYRIYFYLFNPIIEKIFSKTVFYDSVLFAVVFFLGTIFNIFIFISLILLI